MLEIEIPERISQVWTEPCWPGGAAASLTRSKIMTSHQQKLLWGGVGLLVLIFTCCVGVVLGGALSKKQPTPTAAVSIVTAASPIPLPPTEPVVQEPTPTNTLVSASFELVTATPTPVIIVVTSTPLPTEPPPSPSPPPPTAVPSIQPTVVASNDFAALVAYANAIKPILDEGLAAAKRDKNILEAGDQNPAALCGPGLTPHPTLANDARLMHDLTDRLSQITPPPEAAQSVHQPLIDSMRLWAKALDDINESCQTDEPITRGLLRLGAVLQLGGSLVNFHIAADNFYRLLVVNGLETLGGK
jgi:hypothetical protein